MGSLSRVALSTGLHTVALISPAIGGIVTFRTAVPSPVTTLRRRGKARMVDERSQCPGAAPGRVTPAGGSYSEPHLFIFHVGEEGLIDHITAYWDNAGMIRQLGHNEVD